MSNLITLYRIPISFSGGPRTPYGPSAPRGGGDDSVTFAVTFRFLRTYALLGDISLPALRMLLPTTAELWSNDPTVRRGRRILELTVSSRNKMA